MNKRWMMSVVTLLVGVMGSVTASSAAEDYAATIEKLLPGMGAKAIPARQDSQRKLEVMCHEAAAPGKDSERAALSEAILSKCGPDTAKPARVWMLRKIETLGGGESVPGLARLMKDEDAQIRELARRALANNPSAEALNALRSALADAKDAAWQVTLINALGWRRDAESVPALAKLGASNDATVARAAASALGDIGNTGAARALAALRKSAGEDIRPMVIDASLRAAEHLNDSGEAVAAAGIFEELLDGAHPERVRLAALTGLAAARGPAAVEVLVRFVNADDAHMSLIAARCLQRMGNDATRPIVRAMTAADPETKALLLDVLAEHGDRSALQAAAGEIAADDVDVRMAALKAVGALGDSSMVTPLIERGMKTDGAERDAVRAAVAALHGDDVDGMILAQVKGARGPKKVELLYAVWGRRIAAAKPVAFQTARKGGEPARAAALAALERLASTDDLPALTELLINAGSDTTRGLTEQAIMSACRRSGDTDNCTRVVADAVEKAPSGGKVALIGLLAKLQGDAGLPVVRAAAKSDDAAVKKAANAALKQWKPTFITTWVCSGPYEQDGKGPTELFDIAFAPEQAGGAAEWKPAKMAGRGEPTIDLKSLSKGENVCAYSRVTITSDRAQDVILSFGSDDGLKVWLNGEIIHANNVQRGVNCEEDKVKATLKAGKNTLMAKVTQGGSDWSFCCRVGSPEGGPPDGLSFDAR